MVSAVWFKLGISKRNNIMVSISKIHYPTHTIPECLKWNPIRPELMHNQYGPLFSIIQTTVFFFYCFPACFIFTFSSQIWYYHLNIAYCFLIQIQHSSLLAPWASVPPATEELHSDGQHPCKLNSYMNNLQTGTQRQHTSTLPQETLWKKQRELTYATLLFLSYPAHLI